MKPDTETFLGRDQTDRERARARAKKKLGEGEREVGERQTERGVGRHARTHVCTQIQHFPRTHFTRNLSYPNLENHILPNLCRDSQHSILLLTKSLEIAK